MPGDIVYDPGDIPSRIPGYPGRFPRPNIPGPGDRDIWRGPRQAAPVDLRTAIGNLQRERNSFAENRRRSLSALQTAGERGAAQNRKNASLLAARADAALPTSFSQAMGSAERRAKVRQGIVSRGDEAVRNQQLKDRLKIAQQQATRRGSLINVLQTHENIKEGVNAGVSDANARAQASTASMFGSIAGTAAGLGKQWYDRRNTLSEIDMGSLPGYRGDPVGYSSSGQPIYAGTSGDSSFGGGVFF